MSGEIAETRSPRAGNRIQSHRAQVRVFEVGAYLRLMFRPRVCSETLAFFLVNGAGATPKN